MYPAAALLTLLAFAPLSNSRNLEYYRRNTCYNDIFEALALESWLYNHCTNVPFVTFALQGIQNEAERYRYLQWLKAEIQ